MITNTLSPLVAYTVAIVLLLNRHYIIALPIGTLLSSFLLEIIFMILNGKWFSIKKINFKLLKQLLVIGVPLLPNFLIYWIFNSSDRIMISNLLDVGQSGIYAVGSKLGHLSQLINTAFGGGWLFFAYSTMKEENQVKNNSLIFEYLGVISFFSTMVICIISHFVYELLFSSDYVSGYIAYGIINGIAFIASFLLAIIIIKVIMYAVDILTELPVISLMNRLGGLALGLVQGILWIWIIFFFIALLCNTTPGIYLMNLIQSDSVLSVLYNYNLLYNIVMYFVI